MEHHWLDDLARRLATEHSRRAMVRFLGRGLTAAALAPMLPAVAWAPNPCRGGLTDCGGGCVDTSTDPANCGKCGVICPTNPVTLVAQVCVKGKCQPPTTCGGTTCLTSHTCCGTSCVDLATDPNNCGKCGTVCLTGDGCVLGRCRAPTTCGGITCAPGESCCGTSCVNLASDENNCGKCGNICSAPGNYNGTAACVNGTCELVPGP